MCDILKTLVDQLNLSNYNYSNQDYGKVICLCNYCIYSYDIHGDRRYFQSSRETILYRKIVETYGNSWIQQLNTLNDNNYSGKVLKCLQHEGIRSAIEKQISQLITGCSCVGRKNFEKSRQYCARSYEFYKEQDYINALDWVNKGLLYAPRSEDIEDDGAKDALSLAFGCRSHVYNRLGLFYESFLDTVDAHKFAFSEKIKQTTTESVRKMKHLLTTKYGPSVLIGLGLPPYDPLDEFLETVNPEIDGAVRPLYISEEPCKGRTLKTSEPLNAMDTVLIEEPYAAILTPGSYSKYCAYCLKSIDHRFIPCKGCIYLRYCSIDCCEENWKLCHSSECYYMAVLKDFSIGFLALKVILITGVDIALKEYKSRIKDDSNMYNYRFRSIKNRFNDILMLFGREDRNNLMLASTVCCAAYLSVFTKAIGLINDTNLVDFGGLLLKLCMIIDTNGLPISNELQQNSNQKEPDGFHHYVIGFGLYATASLLNHSCLHNCEPLFIGSKLRLTTTRNIRPNEECTINYGCNAISLNYLERQKWLQEKALFTCFCDICKLRV